jgi:hypothetical protein
MKHKSTVVGEMIAFSVCNKPFKPLGIPRGRVKSREGLTARIPTQTHGSYIMSKFKKVNITITTSGYQKSFNL